MRRDRLPLPSVDSAGNADPAALLRLSSLGAPVHTLSPPCSVSPHSPRPPSPVSAASAARAMSLRLSILLVCGRLVRTAGLEVHVGRMRYVCREAEDAVP